MLTREQFLSVPALRVQKVYLPERQDYVFVRELTGAERDQFEASNLIKDRDKKRGTMTYDVRMENARARLVVMGLCDENGTRLLQEADMDAVGRMGAGVITRLYNVIASLSGITDDDLEDLLKN